MEDVTIEYKTNIERNMLLANPPDGLKLKAELKHFDGNFLVFGMDLPPVKTEMEILQERVDSTETALLFLMDIGGM